MIKQLEELSKKFTKPSEVLVMQCEIDVKLGDYKSESGKFIQQTQAMLAKKKRNNVALVAVLY